MDMLLPNSDNILDYYSKEKPIILESDSQPFETVFKDVFQKNNSLNEEEEIENINNYERMYCIKNNEDNFLSAKDKIEDVEIQAIPVSKKICCEKEQNDFINSSICLNEEEEEDIHSIPISSIKEENIEIKKSEITIVDSG